MSDKYHDDVQFVASRRMLDLAGVSYMLVLYLFYLHHRTAIRGPINVRSQNNFSWICSPVCLHLLAVIPFMFLCLAVSRL